MTTLDCERYQAPVYRFHSPDASEDPQLAASDEDEGITVRFEERQFGDPDLSVVFEHGEERDRYRFRVVDEDRRWCRPQGDAPSDLPVAVRHAVTAFGFGIKRDRPADRCLFAFLEATVIYERLLEIEAKSEAYPVVRQSIQDALGSFQTLLDILRAKMLLPESKFRRVWQSVEPPPPEEYRSSIEALKTSLTATLEEATIPTALDRDKLCVIIDTEEVSTVDGEYLFVDMITELDAHRFQFRVIGDDRCVLEQSGIGTVPPLVVKGVQEDGFTVDNVDTIRQATTPLAVAEHAAVFTSQLRDCSLVQGAWKDRLTNPIEVALTNTGVAALWLKLFNLDPASAHDVHTHVCDQHGITTVKQVEMADFDLLYKSIFARLSSKLKAELVAYVQTHPSQEAASLVSKFGEFSG